MLILSALIILAVFMVVVLIWQAHTLRVFQRDLDKGLEKIAETVLAAFK